MPHTLYTNGRSVDTSIYDDEGKPIQSVNRIDITLEAGKMLASAVIHRAKLDENGDPVQAWDLDKSLEGTPEGRNIVFEEPKTVDLVIKRIEDAPDYVAYDCKGE